MVDSPALMDQAALAAVRTAECRAALHGAATERATAQEDAAAREDSVARQCPAPSQPVVDLAQEREMVEQAAAAQETEAQETAVPAAARAQAAQAVAECHR